jgi:hypothetical protein
MKLTQDFNLNEFPFYFLKKKRTLYLKNLYKKKRKYYYFLVSRRKSIKLFSKRYNLDYYLHYEAAFRSSCAWEVRPTEWSPLPVRTS